MPIMDVYWVNEDEMLLDGKLANSFLGSMPPEMTNFTGDIKIDEVKMDMCVPAGHPVEINAHVSVDSSPEMGHTEEEGADAILSLTKDGFPSFARSRGRVNNEHQSLSLHYGEYLHEDTTFSLIMLQNSSNPDALMMIREKEA